MIYNYFRFGGRHLAFWVSIDVSGCRQKSVELGNPENLGIGVGIACLSVVEREIQLLNYGGVDFEISLLTGIQPEI